MFLRKKGFRITAYILLGIFLVLFSFFLFTFDFTSKSKYTGEVTTDEVRSEFSTLLVSAFNDSKALNILEIKADEGIINNAFKTLRGSQEYIFKTQDWIVKGVSMEFDNDLAVINFYLDYRGLIKYSLKVKTYFSLSETTDAYKLTLERMKVGGVIIPSSMTKSLLSNEEESSVGSIIHQAINVLPFGTYDNDTLSLTVKKANIVTSIAKGRLGDTLYGDFEETRLVVAAYIETLLDNNLLEAKIDKGLCLRLNYSRIISSADQIVSTEMKEALSEGTNGMRGVEDDLIIEYLVKGENLALSQYYLSALAYLTASNNALIYTGTGVLSIGDLYNISLSLYSDNAVISLVYRYDDRGSVVNCNLTRISGSLYRLNSVVIGRDGGETENSYLTVEKTSFLNRTMSVLSGYGFEVDVSSLTLDLSSGMASSRIPYTSINFSSNNATMITRANPYTKIIEETLFDSSFQSSLPYYGSRNEIDWTSLTTILTTYKKLAASEKATFLEKLRDYFLIKDVNVYNYIDNIINGGES